MFKTEVRAGKTPPDSVSNGITEKSDDSALLSVGGVLTSLYDCFNGYTLFMSQGGHELEWDIFGELSYVYQTGRDTLSAKHRRKCSEGIEFLGTIWH